MARNTPWSDEMRMDLMYLWTTVPFISGLTWHIIAEYLNRKYAPVYRYPLACATQVNVMRRFSCAFSHLKQEPNCNPAKPGDCQNEGG